MLDLTTLPVGLNFAIFAGAAGIVWVAGTRIVNYADAIGERAGMGHALVGLILLGGITSLPEIGVTVSAASAGDANLAVNNLFGSIAMQVAILAVIDFMIGRRALTMVVPEPAIMLLGALNILLLTVACAGIVVGSGAILGIGVWAWGCLLGYVASVWLLSQTEGRQPWIAADLDPDEPKQRSAAEAKAGADAEALSVYGLTVRTAIAAAIILGAGWAVSRTGSAIAEATGLGSSFVGFVLVAITTSLPEFSTALAAARLGFFTMAISDILGTNLINVGLLFVVDALAGGAPSLSRVGTFAIFGALLAIAVTTIFVIGLAERRDRTFLRMGMDSIAVLVCYLGGVSILYTLR